MRERLRSADLMVNKLLGNPKLVQALGGSQKAAQELKPMASEAKDQTKAQLPDTPLYRMIIGFLGAVGAVAALGAIVLVGMDKDVPQILTALGAAAIGALAGILSPSPAGRQ